MLFKDGGAPSAIGAAADNCPTTQAQLYTSKPDGANGEHRQAEANHEPLKQHGVRCFLALKAAATDPRLSRGDVGVFAVILQHHNIKLGCAWPGFGTLVRDANLSRRSVMESIARLELLHYLKVERPKPPHIGSKDQTNRYFPSFVDGAVVRTSAAQRTSEPERTGLVRPSASTSAPERTLTNLKNIPKELTHKRKRSRAAFVLKVDLPIWLSKEHWEEFVEHRKQLKKPLTQLGAEKTLKSWTRMIERGVDIFPLIDRAIEQGWQAIYEPRDVKQGSGAPKSNSIATNSSFTDANAHEDARRIIAEFGDQP